MKYTQYFIALFITCMTVVAFSPYSAAQVSADTSNVKRLAVKDMIDSQHFVFVAESVTPLRGRFRNLTSLYDVRISKDTMTSYLPYFGRAYTAPLNPSETGLNFTSTNFSYRVAPGKKKSWTVTIKPKDYRDVEQFLFTIYDNGSASLNVNSISRDAISFLGRIQKDENKKNK